MKLFKNINLSYAVLLCITLLAGSCTKVLEENPRSNVTPSAFATPQGLLGGIAGAYNQLRSAWGTEGFTISQMDTCRAGALKTRGSFLIMALREATLAGGLDSTPASMR